MKKTYLFAKYTCIFNEWWMRPLLNWNADKTVRWTKKIRYDENDAKLYLNICEPQNKPEGKLPVYFYIHGGGWVSGKPETREGGVSRVVSQGFFGVSVFYGYSPEYGHPKPVVNVYKALEWVVCNAEKYNLDLDRVYVGGESAGAHLAAVVGAVSSNPAYNEMFALSPVSRNMKFRALFLNCGIYDMNEAAKSRFPLIKSYIYAYYGKPLKGMKDDPDALSMSPLFFVNADFPECMLVSASQDALRFGTETMKKKLSEEGVRYVSYFARGMWAIHAFAVAQKLKKSKEVTAMWLKLIKEQKTESATVE